MRLRTSLYFGLPLAVLTLALVFFLVDWNVAGDLVTDYHPPPSQPGDELVDDQLQDKNPPFVPDLVDRRPRRGAGRLNASAAVLRLDLPMLKPDADAALLAAAPFVCRGDGEGTAWIPVLPSINVIDGKAKQFDDGLFAAIDLACYQGFKPKLPSIVALIERLHGQVRTREPGARLPRGRS